MNIDLKDGELALIEDAIINEIRSYLSDLAASEICYHEDLDVVSNKLNMVQMMITLEDKLWKSREHKD